MVDVLVISPLAPGQRQRDYERLENDGYRFAHCELDIVSKKTLGKFTAPFRPSVIRAIHQSDIVVSYDATLSLGTAAVLETFRLRKPHIAHTFNLVNRDRFHPALDWIARRLLPKVDYIITPSNVERFHFSRVYGIRLDRLGFSHWGVPDSPALDPSTMPPPFRELQPYFCAIGRNNRDFATFCAALKGAPYNGVVVTTPGLLDVPDVPDNVRVFYDLCFDDCLHCIDGAVANVVPLKVGHIGAGHITMVHAMHRGIPQIVSKVDAVADYFVWGQHGLAARLGDPSSLRNAMDYLYANRNTEGRQMGACAQSFAQRWLSNNELPDMLRFAFKALVSNEGLLPLTPVGWIEYLASQGEPISTAVFAQNEE